MGKRREAKAIGATVDNIERELSFAESQISKIVDLSATEGEARQAIAGLYANARPCIQSAAQQVEDLQSAKGLDPSLRLLSTMCAVFAGKQVIALDTTLDALKLIAVADDEDMDYIRRVVASCGDVYSSHESMIRSVRRMDPDDLIGLSHLYQSDPDGASAAFDALLAEFPQRRSQMLAKNG